MVVVVVEIGVTEIIEKQDKNEKKEMNETASVCRESKFHKATSLPLCHLLHLLYKKLLPRTTPVLLFRP